MTASILLVHQMVDHITTAEEHRDADQHRKESRASRNLLRFRATAITSVSLRLVPIEVAAIGG